VRKQNGLNQKEFGRTLTISQAYISRIENGKKIPTPIFTKLFCLMHSVDESLFEQYPEARARYHGQKE